MKVLFIALLWVVSFLANAASLTPQQRVTLAANIIASSEFDLIPHNENGAYMIADAYNTPTAAFVVWKTTLSVDDIMRNGIDWTRVDNLSVGKARIWEWMSRLGSFDCSKTNIRAGVDAVWVGTAADLAVRTYVYAQCKRLATRVEKLFATGTGTDATPALLVFEGAINYRDVADAMGW